MKIKSKRLNQNKFILDISAIVGGTAISQIAIFGSSLVLTRLYSPQNFGILGSFQSIVAVLWIVATLRLDLAIPIAKMKSERSQIFISALTCSLIISTIFGLISFYIFEISEIDLQKYSSLGTLHWIIPLGILTLAFYFSFYHLAISKNQFNVISIAQALRGIGMSFFQIVFGIYSSTSIMLILGYLLGHIGSILVYLKSAKSTIKSFSKKNQFESLLSQTWRIISKYKRFPIYSVPATLTNVAAFQLPTLFLAIIYSPEIGGFYFLAQRIIGLPINLVTNSISQVFLGHSSEMMIDNPKRVIHLFKKLILVMSAIGIIPFTLLFFYGEDLFGFLFGTEWTYTGRITAILTIMYYFRMISMPLSHTLNILEKLKIQMFWDISRFTLLLLLFYLTKLHQLELETFVILFSCLMAIMYIVHIIISYLQLKKVM